MYTRTALVTNNDFISSYRVHVNVAINKYDSNIKLYSVYARGGQIDYNEANDKALSSAKGLFPAHSVVFTSGPPTYEYICYEFYQTIMVKQHHVKSFRGEANLASHKQRQKLH